MLATEFLHKPDRAALAHLDELLDEALEETFPGEGQASGRQIAIGCVGRRRRRSLLGAAISTHDESAPFLLRETSPQEVSPTMTFSSGIQRWQRIMCSC
jgi:hypothetical protein